MKLLTNKQECSNYLTVSFHRKEVEFNRYIREAQIFDLKPLLCDDFYQDLISESPLRDYRLLLTGGSYTHGGRRYEFAGLKAVLAYFIYARYIFTGHQVDTAFGVKEKSYQDSEGISGGERRDIRKMYIQNANELWEDCRKYIERNKEHFPEWEKCNEGCGEGRVRSSNFRITLI